MTHREIKILEDGTHVYEGYHRYTPLKPEERKYGVRKPDDPRAVRFHGRWFLPLELAEERVMPATRPDSDAYGCMEPPACRGCEVCRRPQAARWQRRWRKDQGLRP